MNLKFENKSGGIISFVEDSVQFKAATAATVFEVYTLCTMSYSLNRSSLHCTPQIFSSVTDKGSGATILEYFLSGSY